MNSLTQLLRDEIRAGGPIPFPRFMAAALYHPELGYYERTDRPQVGRAGDFFTSVSVGPVFGELLALHLVSQPAAAAGAWQIVEAGAHDGTLARDILRHLTTFHPGPAERLEYWLLEPSPRRRAWQEEQLQMFDRQVRWCSGVEDLPTGTIRGAIIANELLDALPVERLGWSRQQGAWFRWGVDWQEGRFQWVALPGSAAQALPVEHLPEVPPELAAVLPEGFTTEICPAAAAWWGEAARALGAGLCLTCDYGLERGSWLTPERSQGTLRAYRNHQFAPQVLDDPGEQDLTAHVDFTALRESGEAAGLQTRVDEPQGSFLSRIFARTASGHAPFPDWTPARVRQFQTLTHPEHLGHRFRVLAQERVPA